MEKKERKMVRMPEAEYRRLKRKDKQLMKIKNHIRIAWETVAGIKE